jgi:hypothetical protein
VILSNWRSRRRLTRQPRQEEDKIDRPRLTFGIKTAPQHDARYEAIARVWREADAIPEFEHAWLWDHNMLPPFEGILPRLVREVIELVRAVTPS